MRRRTDGLVMRRLGWLFVVLVCSSMLPGRGGAGEDGALKRVSRAYETIRDLSGDFVQTSEIRELDRREEAAGKFWVMLPDRLRWDYVRPRRQSTILRGSSVRILQEGSDEVLEGTIDRERYGSAPMKLLMGPEVFREDFTVDETGPGVLELRPRTEVPGIKIIRIFVGDGSAFPMTGLEVEDAYGNLNRFVFSGVRVNPGLRETDLELPEGLL